MSCYTIADHTDSYTPAFRAGEGWQELWSVDLDGKTVGVVRRHGKRWSASAYDGKRPSGWARHRFLDNADTKEQAAALVKEFHLKFLSQ